MPPRRELAWSELRVGIFVLVAIAVVLGLFLLNRVDAPADDEQLETGSEQVDETKLAQGDLVQIGRVVRRDERQPIVESGAQHGHAWQRRAIEIDLPWHAHVRFPVQRRPLEVRVAEQDRFSGGRPRPRQRQRSPTSKQRSRRSRHSCRSISARPPDGAT